MHIERPLDAIEIRALGALLEKQLSTPEAYPLTLNSLVTACNQKSNRDPVMELSDEQVRSAMSRLQELQLVWEIHGGRALRYDHRLDGRWGLAPPTRALLALLLLRGPQTAGELRGRSERLHRFESIERLEAELGDLARGDEALVRLLGRRPGQKEARWRHLVGGDAGSEPEAPTPAAPIAESLTGRVEKLEREVEELRRELQALRESLGT
ncbi:MAG TPA: DUF480 domain-containing protein [Thermoanaerobaculia bacterium]|nr:DUF480 domain-containing protein [Thermoanaerobaculia bacterium]